MRGFDCILQSISSIQNFSWFNSIIYYTLLSSPLVYAPISSRSLAFTGWMLGHLFLAINFRTREEPILYHGILNNKMLWIWASAVVVTLIFVLYIPFLASLMKLNYLTFEILFPLLFSIVCICWIELYKLIITKRRRRVELNQDKVDSIFISWK